MSDVNQIITPAGKAPVGLPGYKIVSLILEEMVALSKPGIKTIDIDKKAEELLEVYNVKSYNKGYEPKWAKTPFPYVSCISVNSEITHGFPSEYVLKDGDLVSYDLGLVDSEGNCADAAITVGVGNLKNQDKRLLYYAYQTMMHGVSLLMPNANTEAIAREINQFAALRGYKVNRAGGGHAIGKQMHEKPNIYNTTEPSHTYALLQEGQIFCVEPQITYGNDNIGIIDNNGWTRRTNDNKNSAFFEVMVKVTKDGPQVLTDHIKEIPGI